MIKKVNKSSFSNYLKNLSWINWIFLAILGSVISIFVNWLVDYLWIKKVVLECRSSSLYSSYPTRADYFGHGTINPTITPTIIIKNIGNESFKFDTIGSSNKSSVLILSAHVESNNDEVILDKPSWEYKKNTNILDFDGAQSSSFFTLKAGESKRITIEQELGRSDRNIGRYPSGLFGLRFGDDSKAQRCFIYSEDGIR